MLNLINFQYREWVRATLHKLGEVENKTTALSQYVSGIFPSTIIKIGQSFTTLRLMKDRDVFLTHGVHAMMPDDELFSELQLYNVYGQTEKLCYAFS